MYKLTALILLTVVVSLNRVYADGPDEFMSLVEECAKLNGHTMMELNVVMTKSDVSRIAPCFWGCAFTKTGFLNDKGQYDLDSGLPSIKKFMRDLKGIEKLEKIARICESVKEKDVSDGEAGCERGLLAAECFMENLELMRNY